MVEEDVLLGQRFRRNFDQFVSRAQGNRDPKQIKKDLFVRLKSQRCDKTVVLSNATLIRNPQSIVATSTQLANQAMLSVKDIEVAGGCACQHHAKRVSSLI